jgi:hypothetical protein
MLSGKAIRSDPSFREVASLEGAPSALCPALGPMAPVYARVAEQGASGAPPRLQQAHCRGDHFEHPTFTEMIHPAYASGFFGPYLTSYCSL